MRNVLSIVPKESQEMVASIFRAAFAQPDVEHVATQFDEVVTPTQLVQLQDALFWPALTRFSTRRLTILEIKLVALARSLAILGLEGSGRA